MKDRKFSTGSRRDSATGKAPLSRLMWDALEEVARVHEHGDKHYGMGNWRKGQPFSSPMDSLLRHYVAISRGEDIDPKSGRYHAAHLAWNALFILHMTIHYDHYAKLDDRLDFKGDWLSEQFAKTDLSRQLEKGLDDD